MDAYRIVCNPRCIIRKRTPKPPPPTDKSLYRELPNLDLPKHTLDYPGGDWAYFHEEDPKTPAEVRKVKP